MLRRKAFVVLYILLNCLSSYSRQNEFIFKTKQEFLNIEKKNDTILSSVFNDSDILDITITLNLFEFLNDTANSEPDYPATLIYKN